MTSIRTHRVAELIQTIVARLLITEVNDPRLRSVSITGVDIAPDFKRAIVFFTMLETDDASAIKEAEKAFEKAAGFFRAKVARLAELRHTPQLVFQYDVTIIHGERVSKLLKDE